MRLSAEITRPGYLGLTKNDFREVGRRAMRAVGAYWHQHFKMLHFQKFAFGRYHYRRRTKPYEARKARLHPEAEGRPLVFSGESERQARAASRVKAVAGSYERYRAEVYIDAPTLNFHADEATRVTPSELGQMESVFQINFIQHTHEVAAAKGGTRRLGKVG